MKSIGIWEEPEPQRKKGRDFLKNNVKDGYCSENMYEYPKERRTVEDRKWRKEYHEDD